MSIASQKISRYQFLNRKLIKTIVHPHGFDHHLQVWSREHRRLQDMAIKQPKDIGPAAPSSLLDEMKHGKMNTDEFNNRFFPLAMRFVQCASFQADDPKSQHGVEDNKERRTLQICQLVALLLAHKQTGPEVTAVTLHADLATLPPSVAFVYSKNKDDLTAEDDKRADELAKIFRGILYNNRFIEDLCTYMSINSPARFNTHCRSILKFAPPLLSHLKKMISGIDRKWAYEFDYDKNRSDQKIRELAKEEESTTLEVLLSILVLIIRIADRNLESINGPDLYSLISCCHTLRESTLFMRFIRRLAGSASQKAGEDLWDLFRYLGVFYSSARIMHDTFSEGKWRSLASYIVIRPARGLSDVNLTAIGKKYHLSVVEGDEVKAEVETWPKCDFFDVVQIRSMQTGKKILSRDDWVRQYHHLNEFHELDDVQGEVHCEVKLAMDALSKNRKGKVVIGVSKQPCFCCEAWFDGVNKKARGINFKVDEGHKKVYCNWKGVGIKEGDNFVVSRVWGKIDQMIATVKHVEEKDFVSAIPSKSTGSYWGREPLKN